MILLSFSSSREHAEEIEKNAVFDTATHLWQEALRHTDLVVLAVSGLFKNACCIITSNDNHRYFKEIACFWKNAGCRISIMTPEKHDRISETGIPSYGID